MSAAVILDRLHAAGVRVRLDPEHPDRLRLSPPDRLNGELLELVREHRAALVAALRQRHRLPTPEELASWGEYLLERAAVMEHDGELPRAEADHRAWAELLARFPAAATHFVPGGAA